MEKVPQVLSFSDDRAVEGVVLPHAIIRTMSGRTVTDWRVTKVRLNPPDIRDEFRK